MLFTQACSQERPPPRTDFAVAPTKVHDDVEERKRRYEEQQRLAETQRRANVVSTNNGKQHAAILFFRS